MTERSELAPVSQARDEWFESPHMKGGLEASRGITHVRPSSLETSARQSLGRELFELHCLAFETDMSPFWTKRRNFLEQLDGVYLARMPDGQLVGFLGYQSWRLGHQPVIYLDLGVVLESFRGGRVIRELASLALLRALRQSEFATLLVAARTANPIIIQLLSGSLDPERLWPPMETRIEREVPQAFQETARFVANSMNPECEFDEDKFIIRGALGSELGRMLYGGKLPQAKPEIMEFFSKNVRTDSGDCVVHVSEWDLREPMRSVSPNRIVITSFGDRNGRAVVVWKELPATDPDNNKPTRGVTVLEVDEDGVMTRWQDYLKAQPT